MGTRKNDIEKDTKSVNVGMRWKLFFIWGQYTHFDAQMLYTKTLNNFKAHRLITKNIFIDIIKIIVLSSLTPPDSETLHDWLFVQQRFERELNEKWEIILSNATLTNIDSIKIAWENLCLLRVSGRKHHNNIISIIYWICRTRKNISFHPVLLFLSKWRLLSYDQSLIRL